MRSGRSERERDADGLTAMVLFLGSWAMLFGALFFAYARLRARAPAWPPPGAPPLPLDLGAAAAALMLAGSAALARAGVTLSRGAHGVAAAALALAALLQVAFVGLQVASYQRVHAAGLHLSDGAFAAVFYGLTALHALHVVIGLLPLLWLTWRVARAGRVAGEVDGGAGAGKAAALRRQRRAWALYFHFLAVVFALMLLTVYRA